MPRMYAYLYTIVCCGFDINIYSEQPSLCPGCHSTFTAMRHVPEEATRKAVESCTRMPSLFDGFTMDEALALRSTLHRARASLKAARMAAAELVCELNYGPVRDVIKADHHGYSETMTEISDLACELSRSDLA